MAGTPWLPGLPVAFDQGMTLSRILLATFVALTVALALTACDARPQVPTLEKQLGATLAADRQITPPDYRALAAKNYPLLPVDTLDVTRTKLSTDAKLSPMVQALRDAGWQDEEIATMVTTAATYNSGQPSDVARARGLMLRTAVQDGFDKLETKVAGFEAATRTKVDRQAVTSAMYPRDPDSSSGGGVQ